jgi:penicillin amidase
MRILFRVLRVILALVLVLVAVAGGTLVYFVRQSWPQHSGTVKLAGLKGTVEVLRDRNGVPHIYADTLEDLFMAQGYVHAQDRFFQMEFWRRIGQGRLAELFGKGAARQDRFIRTIGWYRVAEAEAAALTGEIRTVLDSYAAGVNAYLLPNAAKLGFEFKVLALSGAANWTPEPWSPVNTLTWGKAMSFDLGDNADAEILRAALLKQGGLALAEAVMPPYPSDFPVISKGYQSAAPPKTAHSIQTAWVNGTPDNYLALRRAANEVSDAIGLARGSDIGSNNWVVAGSRTNTGKPLLADDPHLGIQMPSIWYQVGLHCRSVSPACPYDVVGVSFAGTPGVIIGHNQRIAWGVTNATTDTQDYYIEKPSPTDPNAFEYKGKFEAAQVRQEVIKIAGQAEPEMLTVRVTRHGPIMNEVESTLKDLPPLALSWTALEPGTLFKSVLEINKAQDWDQFRTALKYWNSAAQNFVYADVDGNIGYQLSGQYPIRAKGDGTVPVEGWTGEYDWTSFVDYDRLPTRYNPPEGFIVTANNAIVDTNSNVFLMARDWDFGYRAERIEQMITAKEKLSIDDFKAMHNDSTAIFADELLPALFAALPELYPDTPQPLIDMLKNWDKRYTRDSQGALVYEQFKLELSRCIFGDESGALSEDALSVGSVTQTAIRNVLKDPAAPWWDDTRTPIRETQKDILLRALGNASQKLHKRFGDDYNTWRNQTLGTSGIAPIERIFNRGPFPADGGSGLVNAVGHRSSDFSVRSVPSMRMIVDLSNLDQSQLIHTTGQSGHAFHVNYDDMIDAWLNGRYNALVSSPSAVKASAASTLTLTP